MDYKGTEGTRPYAGAGAYYAEYRDRVSIESIALLARRLGWSTGDRVLDLGAGPGQLSLLIAPLVTEVVAIEPEPDMLAEGKKTGAGGRHREREIRGREFGRLASTADVAGPFPRGLDGTVVSLDA